MALKTRGTSHEDRAHAPLPPSASERWLKCPPSMAYVAKLIKTKVIKKRESGEAAKRGTRIHELAAPMISALIKGRKAVFPRSEEGEIAKKYAHFCHALYEEALIMDDDAIYGVEQKAIMTDECWGSSDFWIKSGSRLIVVDLKTGRDPIDPKDKTQLLLYAVGVCRTKKLDQPKEVEAIIYQPGNGPDDHARHVYDYAAWIRWCKDLNEGIKNATHYLNQGDKVRGGLERDLVAGDHCEWCDALGVCDRAKRYALAISSKNFTPVPIERAAPPEVSTLEPDQVGLILERAPMFISWLDAVRVRALELAHKGRRIPGFKVVPKITRRAWEKKYNAGAIAKGVGLPLKDIQDTKLKSPAQVEELLKGKDKQKVSKYTFKPLGEPTVVPESDKRQALPSTKISFTPVSHTEED